MNQRVFLIGLIVALVIAVASLVLGIDIFQKTNEGLAGLAKKTEALSTGLQEAMARTAPYVYVGEAVGYVIDFENGTKFYFAGDTGLSADMKIVGDYYKPDVAFLPIGNIYTLDPKAAAYAAYLVNPSHYIVPMHYASYPALVQTPDEFFNELSQYNLRAKPLDLKVGDSQDVLGVKTLSLGHCNWLFESPQGTKILTDPEVEFNARYPEKYKDLSLFKKIDLILITHGHFDHMTVPDLKKWVALYDPIIIAPFEAAVWLKDNLPTKNIMGINKGSRISKADMLNMGMPAEKVAKIADIVINMVSADHSSSATPESASPRY